MSSVASGRFRLRLLNHWGERAARPVVVEENRRAAIEVGSYSVDESGLSFAVILVERLGPAPRILSEDFALASNDSLERNATVVVGYPGGRWGTTVEAVSGGATSSALSIDLPFGPSGTGIGGAVPRERFNGDRIVQHVIKVPELPGDLKSKDRSAAPVEIGVQWPMMGLHVAMAMTLEHEPGVALGLER